MSLPQVGKSDILIMNEQPDLPILGRLSLTTERGKKSPFS